MENFLIKLLEWLWDKMERYVFFWVVLREFEGGVVLLLGKYHYTLKKGFNWKFPLIHESLTCLTKPETFKTTNETITTKDGKVVTISFVSRYEVTDERKFLLDANDAETNIVHELIMVGCNALTDMTWDEIKDKKSYTDIKAKANRKIEYMGAKFMEIGFGSNCITRPFSLINH